MKNLLSLIYFAAIIIQNFTSYAQDRANNLTGFDTAINTISYHADFAPKQLFDLSDEAYTLIKSQESAQTKETAFDPVYFIFNGQYLMAEPQIDGGGYFEVGYANKELLKRRHCKVKSSQRLITNNNIQLGMDENNFNKSLGMPWGKFYLVRPNIVIQGKTYTVYYHYIEGGGSYQQQFATINNSPSYIARYVFCKGKLIKFGFGNLPYHPTHEFEDLINS